MKRITISFILFTAFVLLIIGAQGLFAQAPTIQAIDVTFSSVQTYQFSFTWTNGNGTSRAAFVYLGNTTLAVPVDLTTYIANPIFGSGTQIGGTGWYCVYNGTGAATTVTVTSLAAGYVYRVMVLEYNGVAGSEEYLQGAGVTDNPKNKITLTAAPTLTAPINGLTGVSVLPTLDWDAVTGAVTYKVYVDDNSDCSSPFFSLDIGAGTIYSFVATISGFPLTNGTLYYWKVAGVNASGEGNSSLIYHFTTAPGFTVSQHTPTTGQAIQSTTVDLGWSLGHSANGLTFRIEYMIAAVAPTAESDWSGATPTTVTGNSNSSYTKQLTGLTLGKTYYWRVLIRRTSNSEYVHYPAPTTYNYFSTEGGTTVTVTANWPTDGTIVYTNTPRLDWTVSGYTTGLTYQVCYVQSDADPGVDGDGKLVGATNYPTLVADFSSNKYLTLPALMPGKKYYWQVRAYYASTTLYSAWSARTYFINNGSGTLEVPVANYPRDGVTIYSNTPRLDWTLTTSGTGLTYQVCYVQSSADPGVDGDGKLIGATNYPVASGDFSSNKYLTLPTLTPGQTYWWQVRSYSSTIAGLGGTAYSAWSSRTSFVNSGPGTLSVPVPNWPKDGITIYTTAPELTWYLTTYSTGLYYEIEYDLAANGLTGDPDVQTTTADIFSKQLTGLTPGASYHYKIRSKNVTTFPAIVVGTYSSWSSEGTFTVAGGTTASYAVANWPISGTIYTNPPTLTWYLEGSTLGITGYNVKYKKANSDPGGWVAYNPAGNDADGGKYTGLSTSTFSKLLTAELTYGAKYYWAVYATGTTDPVNAASVGYFTVVGGAGSTTVVNSYPYNASTVYSTTVPFSWYISGSTAGITSYTLMYSPSDTWGVADVTVTPITGTSRTITGLTNGNTYYWKVRANYADGSFTAFSDTWSFTIQQGSSIIVQPWIGGPHNVAIGTTSPTFSWILPVPPAAGLKYELEYATSPSFINSTKIENVPNQYATVSGLSSNTKYFWRVRSKATDGTYSYYSNLGKFDVGLPTGVEDPNTIPDEFSLKQNYPNPFNPSTKISFDLPEAARVTIKVFNTIGQLVATVASNELLNAGRYERTFDASGLPTGIYIYQLNSDKFNAYKKMLMIK